MSDQLEEVVRREFATPLPNTRAERRAQRKANKSADAEEKLRNQGDVHGVRRLTEKLAADDDRQHARRWRRSK